MEVKDLSEINYAPYNPRVLSDHMGKSLDDSLNTYGDLGSITFNRQTNTLVVGHQRLKILEARYPNRVKIYIEHRFDAPDEYGTIATGFVGVEGTNLHLAYRETQWSLGQEKSANLASNKIQADFDNDLLEQQIYDLSQLENGDDLLGLSGFDEDEIAKLLNDSGAIDLEQEKPAKADDGMKRLTAKFTDDQFSTLYEAIAIMKRNRTLTQEQNNDLDANALYYICKSYVENITSQNDAQTQETIETPPAGQTTTQPESAGVQTDTSEYQNYQAQTTQPTSSADDLTSIPTDQSVPTEQ